eukprot:TRINITY_DN53939_c0_g1_i1.p1 TRINITY_DN53939_c0_g1~~TRINITY_DN53939_c0_g1_i1.p1  ORF type:complete len:347 (-),score=60.00 TRINITY_DN53939_c0_g1_i1:285-1271(-)
MSHLVVFGDSYSDSGTAFSTSYGLAADVDRISEQLAALVEVWGDTYPPACAGYADGRATNGPTWVEFVAKDHRLALHNYAQNAASSCGDASSGELPDKFPKALLKEIPVATGLASLGPKTALIPRGLPQQVKFASDHGVLGSESIVVIAIGVNDKLMAGGFQHTTNNLKAALLHLLRNESVEAQHIFVIPPWPMHLSPCAAEYSCTAAEFEEIAKEIALMCKELNVRCWCRATELISTWLAQADREGLHPSEPVVCFYTQKARALERVEKSIEPSTPTVAAWGLEVSRKDAEKCIWFDEIHLTTSAHRRLASAFSEYFTNTRDTVASQ